MCVFGNISVADEDIHIKFGAQIDIGYRRVTGAQNYAAVTIQDEYICIKFCM